MSIDQTGVVDAIGVDLDLHRRVLRLGVVKGERAVEVVEASGEPAEPQMLNAEVDRGV